MRANLFSGALFLAASSLALGTPAVASEVFTGCFAEPADGGNLDTQNSRFDGTTVVIVARAHASEAVNGSVRWRNVLFAIRGMQGRKPVFRLPLAAPGTGARVLAGDSASLHEIKPVWSYEPNAVSWNSFDRYTRTGSTWKDRRVEAANDAPFTHDVVYVSINEHFPVGDFYSWLETDVFTHPLVSPTPSEATPGSFMIGYQSGAPASAACSRAIPDMPLYAFTIRDPAAHPARLVMLVSGQHPYEGQNKVALEAAVDWILNSTSPEARAYRQQYVTVVYPFVNPTGELAGLWRGTASDPDKDTNRNWDTTETAPARDRGIDTVIIHKNAMRKDIAALGLGEPYAVFDYHQNFGDRPGVPDYVLRWTSETGTNEPAAGARTAGDFMPYFARLASAAPMADVPSDLGGRETLRGYMVSRGVTLPLTFERSVDHTIASEWDFGLATVKALADPSLVAAVVAADRASGSIAVASALKSGAATHGRTLLALHKS